jgi:peptidyl-prolyl cis-trans isomerase SurA
MNSVSVTQFPHSQSSKELTEQGVDRIMFIKRLSCIATIAVLLAFTVNLATARKFDEIIAYVNEDVVTRWELENLVKQRAMELQYNHRFSPREAMEKAQQERPELLDRLIRQLLLVETALTLKIEVTEPEMEQFITNFKEQAQIKTEEDFIKQLKTEGLTMSTFREQAKRNLMAEKLVMGRIRPKIQIRDSDIQKFFEENRSQFSTKADTVHLKHIFIAFKSSESDRKAALQKVEAIRQEVVAGKDFQALAQSVAPTPEIKAKAGMLIEVPPNEIKNLSTPFRIALSTLTDGQISEPIEHNDGVYLFKVANKTDEQIAFCYLAVPLKPNDDAIAKARVRADEVHQKLSQGEDFALLAQRYSDDSDTRAKGGDLGIRALSELNPDTRKIIEALQAGQHTKPFDTQFGLHIFKIGSRTPPELSDLEKDQIRIFLSQQQFQEEWGTYTDMLLENAYVKIKPLDEAREERTDSGKAGD